MHRHDYSRICLHETKRRKLVKIKPHSAKPYSLTNFPLRLEINEKASGLFFCRILEQFKVEFYLTVDTQNEIVFSFEMNINLEVLLVDLNAKIPVCNNQISWTGHMGLVDSRINRTMERKKILQKSQEDNLLFAD